MKFVEYFKTLLYPVREINWFQWSNSQRKVKAEKPKYPDASKEVRRRARSIEKRRLEAIEQMETEGKVVQMKRRAK